jgi:hypothetical protein
MRFIHVILIAIALVSISLVVPIWLPEKSDYLTNFSTILTLQATIASLSIALLLMNQLGLNQTILEKKGETVIKLLGLLHDKHFFVETNLGFSNFVPVVEIKRFHQTPENKMKKNLKLLFEKDYEQYIEPIVLLSYDMFLPKEIAEKVRMLEVAGIIPANNLARNEDYAKVHVKPSKSYTQIVADDDSDGKDWWRVLRVANNKAVEEISLNEYIGFWDGVVDACHVWLLHHSTFQDLNVQFNVRFSTKRKWWQRQLRR